ncbi:hypothetical protein N7456_001388 [Penicillium angulare]|uniref:Uncharacterized protein n=1 Tax=Penicillium angulare TaxID=116970 RepID=A0A9W9GEY6_9EURO|nr:hypothetical protein N7456_001388 [Penicillium angulare]
MDSAIMQRTAFKIDLIIHDPYKVETPVNQKTDSATLSGESNERNYRLNTVNRASEGNFVKSTHPNWSVSMKRSQQETSDFLVEQLIFSGGSANQSVVPQRTGKPLPQQAAVGYAGSLRINTQIGSRFYARRDDIEHVGFSPS